MSFYLNKKNTKVKTASCFNNSTSLTLGSFLFKKSTVNFKPNKVAAELITGKRKTKPIYATLDRLVFDKDELAPPTDKDFDNFRGIIKHMERAQPYRLADAKVLSGRVQPSVLINAIADRAGEDILIERMAGDRAQAAQYLSHLTPSSIEQLDAAYFPQANSVVLNNRSPGVLIHELGHAVDMTRGENSSNLARYLSNSVRPLNWLERQAWNKGQRTYREGFAEDYHSLLNDREASKDKLGDILDNYIKNMESVNNRKYPALGTYYGTALGGLTGGVAGSLAGIIAGYNILGPEYRGSNSSISLALRTGLLGALGGTAAGSGLGLYSGPLLGKAYAKYKLKNVRNKEMRELDKQLQKIIKRKEKEKVKNS
jgi:hypothetical protein